MSHSVDAIFNCMNTFVSIYVPYILN